MMPKPRRPILFPLVMLSMLAFGSTIAEEAAQQPQRGTFFQASDVALSPRFFREGWEEAYRAFGANRIAWTYAGNVFVQMPKLSSAAVQCAMPFWVPRDRPHAAEMVCLSGQNQPISERFGDGTLLTYPNVFSSAWREFALETGKALADKGCRHFMQDDPARNIVLRARGGCRSVGARLRPPAEERNAIVQYHRWLNAELRTYVAKIDPTTKPTFSANITNRGMPTRAWLLGEFDYLTSEIYASRATTVGVLQNFATSVRNMRTRSAVTFASADIWLTQRSIASAYALGLVPIVPWDVYISTTAPRFFGAPESFAGIYGLVRANRTLFDNYVQDQHARRDTVDAGAPGYFVTIRRAAANPSAKLVHVVNWGEPPRPLTLRLTAAAFPAPPDTVITVQAPAPARVTPTRKGAYWVYNLGQAGVWVILFRSMAP